MEEGLEDRASLYLAMTLALMGFEEGIKFSKKIGAKLIGLDFLNFFATKNYEPCAI